MSKYGFSAIKEVVEEILGSFYIQYSLKQSSYDFLDERSSLEIYVGESKVGYIGEIAVDRIICVGEYKVCVGSAYRDKGKVRVPVTVYSGDMEHVIAQSNVERSKVTADTVHDLLEDAGQVDNKVITQVVMTVRLADFKREPNIALCEIDFHSLVELAVLKRSYKQYADMSVKRDLAVVLDENITWERLESCVRKSAPDFLEAIEFFDIYRGNQIPKGKKSIAFSLSFCSKDKTLTNEEVDAVINKIVENIKKDVNGYLRQ